MEGYFHLAEHFITQGHPAFCGIGSLTMALNSLLLDPGRVWQGVWRWFDESMLDCCEPLDIVRMKGITLPKLSCLARCNGASSVLKYGDKVSVETFRRDVMRVCSSQKELLDGKDCCCSSSYETTGTDDSSCNSSVPNNLPQPAADHGRTVMVVAYHRGTLNQSGTGHFSPIGGYCAEDDLVLVMDVARFKYPPHWVPLPLLHRAMQEVDPETQRSRGYLMLSALPELMHRCECSEFCDSGTPSVNSATLAHVEAEPSAAQKPSGTLTNSTTTDQFNMQASAPLPQASSAEAAGCTNITPSERLTSLLRHSCPDCSGSAN